jgi:hypothetical protein
METFGVYREAELKKFLELPNGIPDESTFFWVFKQIQPGQLAQCLYEWLAGAGETDGRAINIDGKTIRGSAGGEGNPVPVVSAWAGGRENRTRTTGGGGKEQRDNGDTPVAGTA